MSHTSGKNSTKGRIPKAEALERVYIIKSSGGIRNSIVGVCTFPQSLVGLRFKLLEVK